MKRDLKYWIRLISVGLFGGVLMALIIIEAIFVVGFSKPTPSVVGSPPSTVDHIEIQPVTLINTEDQINLSGWYVPSRNRAAVILLHGYGSNRLEMLSRAEVLARHGYGVLLFDLRGHGESQGNKRAFGWEDTRDVDTALQFLSDREEIDQERIGILGFSVGGQIAIRAGAEQEQIKAVIADDPGFVTVDDAPQPQNNTERLLYLVSWIDYRLISLWTGIPIPQGVIEMLEKIPPKPIMFIATGQSQGYTLVHHYYQLTGEPKELWDIPETYHGGQFNARPEEYEDRMIDFFDAVLLESEK